MPLSRTFYVISFLRKLEDEGMRKRRARKTNDKGGEEESRN
jgi:hypothetical protein